MRKVCLLAEPSPTPLYIVPEIATGDKTLEGCRLEAVGGAGHIDKAKISLCKDARAGCSLMHSAAGADTAISWGPLPTR